jgi:RNA recognition motif-containing protein
MSSAVDNLVNNMASVSILDPSDQSPNGVPAQADAASASADEGRRLYIGNLAYATTEGELKEFFNSFTV